MNRYEIMFLLDANWYGRSAEDAEVAVDALIQKHGGSITRAEKWDERKLAYSIKVEQTVHRRGVYYLTAVDLEAEKVEEVRREIELSPNVLRALILRRSEENIERIFDPFPDVMARRPREGDAAEAKPAEGEAKPADGEAKPAEGEAKPAEGEAKPAAEGDEPAAKADDNDGDEAGGKTDGE